MGAVGRGNNKFRLGRRFVALLAAYAIAISGLIASFGGAYAEATLNPAGAICHHVSDGQPSPLGNQSNGVPCTDCGCCIGCLMPLAALPLPPAIVLPSQATISQRLAPPGYIALGGGRIDKSHRSRAPPLQA